MINDYIVIVEYDGKEIFLMVVMMEKNNDKVYRKM